MNLYPSIAQRKSSRRYDLLRPLDQATLAEIVHVIESCAPLYSDINLSYRFTEKVKGRFHVEAPHYLIISGQGLAGEMESAGFIFERLVLWLDAHNIGSVWLGSSRDTEVTDTSDDIVTIAFGTSVDPVHRDHEGFKRKPIEHITNTVDDPCIQAAHLAPSGMNTQPWYFMKQDDRVLVYKQKLKPPVSLVYKLSDIDMGIALCHYAVACEEMGKGFRFDRSEDIAEKPGYLPFGVISE